MDNDLASKSRTTSVDRRMLSPLGFTALLALCSLIGPRIHDQYSQAIRAYPHRPSDSQTTDNVFKNRRSLVK